jgi:hypothetical protein
MKEKILFVDDDENSRKTFNNQINKKYDVERLLELQSLLPSDFYCKNP